jgi:gluconate 2-dehydrogenase alpha chain
MATKLKHVDVVTIGVGLTGAILGKELAAAGLKVVGLERGQPRDTVPDFQGPNQHDELRYAVRKALMQDNTKEAMTARNNPSERALPMRRWEGFLPGTGVGARPFTGMVKPSGSKKPILSIALISKKNTAKSFSTPN